MASVTQTVSNYLGGVSKQTDDKKMPGQVRECLNALPDPTFGLMKRPGLKHERILATSNLDDAKWFYIHRDGDEKYIGRISTGSPGDIAIWNAATGVACTVTYSGGGQAYLTTTRDNYDILTVQDTSFITNKTTTVTKQAAPTHTANKVGTISLHNVKYSTKYEATINGSTTASYITRNDDNYTSGAAAFQVLNADDILTQLKTNIDALSISGLTVTKLESTLELSCSSAFTLTVNDYQGNSNLSSFQEQVTNISRLPFQSVEGRLVKVVNTSAAESSYWTKFSAENGTSGDGNWVESLAPDVSPGLTASTMPHELSNTAPDTFTFQPVAWNDRLVGDETTNSDPSFVGKKIEQAFFHNNRLGFLTNDNVSMSQAGDIDNFFFTSALTSTDSDPIDISCSSIRPAKLHGIIPTAQGLILFSQNQQFIMFSDSEILTPASAVIRGISNYEMDTVIDPVDVGTDINFVSKTPSYTRIFGMQTKGSQDSPLIHDIGKVVSEWVPDTITDLIASPQNSLIAMYGVSSDMMYLYKTYAVGGKNLMQSWVKWQLPGDIQFSVIDSDNMYAVVKHGNNYDLLKASMTQTPEEEIIVTSAGQQVNPHMDYYAAVSSMTYDSTNNQTLCYLPYHDVPTLTPVLVIAGNGTTNFNGVTESGFTITPERPAWQNNTTANPYFIVPNKDISSLNASDVIVGYKYNYDVLLPKTYFKAGQDQKSDYTANLTIARMKFSVGLSSVVGFKVKSKGYRGPIAEFTGDGSTTLFIAPFELKEENGIKVTLDGAATTDYTLNVIPEYGSEVTFNTAPTGYVSALASGNNKEVPAQKIVITTDTWYDVQPVQEAGEYLADDVPLTEDNIFTIPIHQRTDNFNLRVFSNSPFPVSLNSMSWEGNYSPRFYRRT